MVERIKSLEEIYEEVDRESELECYDKEDLKLKDQEPFIMVGKSASGNILIRIGDELGYDVSKQLSHTEALQLIKKLSETLISRINKMNLVNPDLSSVKYRRRKIQVIYKNLKDCYGMYDPNKHILYIDQNIKGERLFNTLMHELFHIIIYNENIDVNKRGEEPIAQTVGDGYTRIFKQNPNLWDILTDLLFK